MPDAARGAAGAGGHGKTREPRPPEAGDGAEEAGSDAATLGPGGRREERGSRVHGAGRPSEARTGGGGAGEGSTHGVCGRGRSARCRGATACTFALSFLTIKPVFITRS